MSITKETITFTCPSCGHTTKRHTVVKELAGGRKPTCEECGGEILIDREVLVRISQILHRLGLTDTTGVTTETRSTVTLHCPHCGASASVSRDLLDLEKRDTFFCPNCGKEIPIDWDEVRPAQHGFEGLSTTAGDTAPATGSPAPSGPTGGTPKRGCLGVMAGLTLSALVAALLICVFL